MMDGGASLESRVAALEARAEIGDLVARYALGADRQNDPLILGPLFADDATWSSEGFAALEGRDAITAELAEVAANRVLWSIHYMVSPLIEIGPDGTTATCTWYLWELCTLQKASTATDSWFGGWYDSSLVKTNAGWRFSRVVLDVRLEGEAHPAWKLKKPVTK